MDITRIVTLLAITLFFAQTAAYAEPVVCTGPKKLFSKEGFADHLLPESQDQISENTKLTRQNTRGLFNISLEDTYTSTSSPANTEWAFGSAADFQTLTFNVWEQWHGKNPPSTVGENAVIHVIDEDLYLDINFLSWAQRGSGGGGFSYIRSTCNSILLDIKANNSDALVTLSPAEVLNLTVSIDPSDRLGESADWWLLAATQSGIFYYDLSSNTWQPGITPTFQGALFSIPEFTISTRSGLPGGPYTFYFGFDDVVNGILDLPNILFDSVMVETSSS